MLIENVDYFVYVVPFPNGANRGAVLPNDDGTFDVYLNAMYTDLKEGYEHEVRHILHDHFYEEGKTIAQIEREADGKAVKKETKTIPLYSSLDALKKALLPAILAEIERHPEIKFA